MKKKEFVWPDPQTIRTADDLTNLVDDYCRQTGQPMTQLRAAARLFGGHARPDAYDVGGTIQFDGPDAETRSLQAEKLIDRPGSWSSCCKDSGGWRLTVPTEYLIRSFRCRGVPCRVETIRMDGKAYDDATRRQMNAEEDEIVRQMLEDLIDGKIMINK